MRSENTIDKFGRKGKQKEAIQIRGPPGVGYKLASNGNYDIQGKTLTNVANPTNASDVATQEYVLKEIHELRLQITNIINKEIMHHFHDITSNLDKRIENLEKPIKKSNKNIT